MVQLLGVTRGFVSDKLDSCIKVQVLVHLATKQMLRPVDIKMAYLVDNFSNEAKDISSGKESTIMNLIQLKMIKDGQSLKLKGPDKIIHLAISVFYFADISESNVIHSTCNWEN